MINEKLDQSEDLWIYGYGFLHIHSEFTESHEWLVPEKSNLNSLNLKNSCSLKILNTALHSDCIKVNKSSKDVCS